MRKGDPDAYNMDLISQYRKGNTVAGTFTDSTSILLGLSQNNNSQILLFPNPADESVTIQLPEIAHERISLKMFDVNGHELFSKEFEKGDRKKVIDTQELAGGIYLVHLENGDTITRKKVIVIHK